MRQIRVNEASLAFIDPSYFDVLESPILAGRAFHSGDLAPDARVVIVDQGFVDRMLDGRNAIGQRVRFAAEQKPDGTLSDEARPWYEIVGVVKDLGMMYPTHRRRAAGLYFPADPAMTGPLHLMVHVKDDPMSLAPRVRELSTAVDATLRLADFQRVDEVTDQIQWVLLLWLRITMVLTAIALLLSLAGIYAVLSFTVARRTREIGVRVALGASRLRVVAAIFRRPLIQVAIGVVVGGALIAAGAFALAVDGLSLSQLACSLPMRRSCSRCFRARPPLAPCCSSSARSCSGSWASGSRVGDRRPHATGSAACGSDSPRGAGTKACGTGSSTCATCTRAAGPEASAVVVTSI